MRSGKPTSEDQPETDMLNSQIVLRGTNQALQTHAHRDFPSLPEDTGEDPNIKDLTEKGVYVSEDKCRQFFGRLFYFNYMIAGAWGQWRGCPKDARADCIDDH